MHNRTIGLQTPIHKLVMLGTPNRGSANVYTMWEGGDPKMIDDATDSGLASGVNTYFSATKDAFEKLTHKKWSQLWSGIPGYEVVEFYKEHIPSTRDLMPVYEFLNVQDGENNPQKTSATSSKNIFLEELNNDYSWGKDLFKSDCTSNPNPFFCLETRLFLTNNLDTINTINVKSPVENARVYPSGESYDKWGLGDWYDKESVGDGTVDAGQASQPFSSDPEITVTGEFGAHASMWKSDDVKGKIYNFLTGKTLPAQQKASVRTIPQKQLSIQLSGNVQPYLVDEQSNMTGVEPVSLEVKMDISGSDLVLIADSSLVTVDDPTGQFTLSFLGPVTDDFELRLIYADENKHISYRYVGHYTKGTTRQVVITINPDSTDSLEVVWPIDQPSSVTVDDTQGNARINWNSVRDAVSYNVYTRTDSQPIWMLLGNTTETYYQTTHPFSDWDNIRFYRVTAVRATGAESVFADWAEKEVIIDDDGASCSGNEVVVDSRIFLGGTPVTCVGGETITTVSTVEVRRNADVTFQAPSTALGSGFKIENDGVFRIIH